MDFTNDMVNNMLASMLDNVIHNAEDTDINKICYDDWLEDDENPYPDEVENNEDDDYVMMDIPKEEVEKIVNNYFALQDAIKVAHDVILGRRNDCWDLGADEDADIYDTCLEIIESALMGDDRRIEELKNIELNLED